MIERFITDHFPDPPKGGDIGEEFETFWTAEKLEGARQIIDSEDLEPVGLQDVIGTYQFNEKTPMRDGVIGIMNTRPGLKGRATVSETVTQKIKDYVHTFFDGVTDRFCRLDAG